MAERYLIDTNIIIDFSEERLSAEAKSFIANVIDHDPRISVINKIELLGFSSVTKSIIEFVKVADIISLSDAIIDRTISIRKTYRIKLPDAVIAATSLIHKLTLITNNDDDFNDIKGLKIFCPRKKMS